jgi:hypothetical protein
MMQARIVVIDILSERNGHKINLTALSRELDRLRILGFGVEAKDVVYALEREGKVVFDRKTEMVYLVRKYLSGIVALRSKCVHRLTGGDIPPGLDSDDVALPCFEDSECPNKKEGR